MLGGKYKLNVTQSLQEPIIEKCEGGMEEMKTESFGACGLEDQSRQ